MTSVSFQAAGLRPQVLAYSRPIHFGNNGVAILVLSFPKLPEQWASGNQFPDVYE